MTGLEESPSPKKKQRMKRIACRTHIGKLVVFLIELNVINVNEDLLSEIALCVIFLL